MSLPINYGPIASGPALGSITDFGGVNILDFIGLLSDTADSGFRPDGCSDSDSEQYSAASSRMVLAKNASASAARKRAQWALLPPVADRVY